ncbi:MAG: hypothetical protein JSW28_02615, partial [Thermoplasmata archaeon]
ELVNLEIEPAPHNPKNYAFIKFITLSGEDDMVFLPKRDAEMLYEKINNVMNKREILTKNGK